MDIIALFKEELEYEYQVNKKFIENFPDGKNDYKPHEKSMELLPLTQHIVDIFGWPVYMTTTDFLDLSSGSDRKQATNKKELLEQLENNYAASKESFNQLTEEVLQSTWSLNHGDTVLAAWSKQGAIRHSLNQITHHRAQLGVYYRLLDIPLPGSYGPSADDQSF